MSIFSELLHSFLNIPKPKLSKDDVSNISQLNFLEGILPRLNNNFDLLRLVLASTVIFSHAFVLSPKPKLADPLYSLIHFDNSGGAAVRVFFLMSGLFVVDSVISKQSILYFCLMRISRIFPGLFICLFVTVFLVGPLFTELSFAEYIRSPDTLSYLYRNLILTGMQWQLPGVFVDSKYVLNGSIWTLPLEIRLYVVVAFMLLLGVFKGRFTATLAIVAGVYLFLRFNPYTVQLTNETGIRLIECFAAGGLSAIYKKYIPINWIGVIFFLSLTLVLWKTSFGEITFYIALSYALIYLFQLPSIVAIRLRGDYSYGTYIYGFVVQQIFANLFPNAGPIMNASVCIPSAIGIGMLSWTFVERPALRFSRQLYEKLVGQLTLSSVAAGLISVLAVTVVVTVPEAIRLIPDYGVVASAVSDVRITNYGPSPIVHRESFNVQPDGSSAIWVKVNHPLSPLSLITLGETRLVSAPSGDTITAVVPSQLFAVSGELELRVVEDIRGHPAVSPAVKWYVR